VRIADLGVAAAGERRRAGDAFVEQAAERVQVAGGRGRAAFDQLRREVVQAANELALARELRRVGAAREPEVGEHSRIVGVEEHVRGLHVTVDHAARVQRVESLPELGGESRRLGDGQRDPARQRAARIQRHDEVVVADFEDLDQVPGAALGRETRLARETLLRGWIGASQHLQSDVPRAVCCAVDDAAGTLAQQLDHVVAFATHAAIIGDR
jgi:hypothetical protein